jgi:gamma-glutamylcyclotransferase
MISTPAVLNFAYGSNMLSRRIRERVPSARCIGIAVLRGHELRWHKAGQDGSAKCDVITSSGPDAIVHGAIYEIAAAEKILLDKAEGLGAGYNEKQVQVESNWGTVTTWVYHATNIDASLVPFAWYKALVVAGAREHELPSDYVAKIEAVPARSDLNLVRAARNLSLAGVS